MAAGTATAVAGPAQISALIKGLSIKKRSIPGNRLRPNTLGGRQIRESKLGEVPLAAHAGSADSATRAGSAGHADSAAHADVAPSAGTAAHADGATTATTAANANALAGKPASSYAGGPGQLVLESKQVFALAPTFFPVYTLPGVGTLKAACHQGSFAIDFVWESASGVPYEDVDMRVYDSAHALGQHDHATLSNGGATFVETIATQGGTLELQVGTGHDETTRALMLEGLYGRADTAGSCRLTLTGIAR
jgi:hypothetical protein